MTITTKYNIGDSVWHAEGAYAIPVRVRVKDIIISYDEYGNLLITYGFGSEYWRVPQDKVFISESTCQEYVNNKP